MRLTSRHFAIACCAFALVACGDDDSMMMEMDAGTDTGMMGTDSGPDTGGDPCDGVSTCDSAGVSCDGEFLVTCAANADGCLIEARESCEFGCNDGTGAMCAPDPCEGVDPGDLCDEADAGATCDGTDLVVCAANATGCFVNTTTDCTMEDGANSCAADDDGAMCVNDPCAGRTDLCDTEGTSCDGDDVLTCAPDAFGCLVATTTSCADRGATCDDSGDDAVCAGADCADTPNPCDTEGTSCAGPELVTCATDAFGCLAETTTDCTDALFGVCNPDADPAACEIEESDPCDGVDECTEGRTCDMDTLNICARDARGCFVNAATDCTETSSVCDDSGDMAICLDQCPQATTTGVVLDCNSSMTMPFPFDTADGTADIDRYTCASFSYPRNEAVFRFAAAMDSEVEIVSTRGEGAGDMDLFVLEGGGVCGSATPCVDGSTSTADTETVNFVAGAGEPFYVAYDLFGSGGPDTTGFTLEITCTEVVCGDDVISGDEECDDGDMEDGDGCASDCTVESGFVCTEEPSVCVVSCGNSVVDPSEGCDDGNMDPGDGCAADCSVEADYVCTGEPSMCEIACGNGDLNDGEGCDDGGTEESDGCSRDCMVETGFECRAEPSVCLPAMCGDMMVGWAESCDDMNDTEGDGCHLCALEIDAAIDALPPGDPDRIITLSGSIADTDPTWSRPSAGCTGGAANRFYDEHRIINTTGEEQTLTITATWMDDGYLHVFGPSFDPSMPTAMCIAGDDDFSNMGAAAALGSQIVDVTIGNGETLSIVASTFSAADAIGDYTIDVEVTTPP